VVGASASGAGGPAPRVDQPRRDGSSQQRRHCSRRGVREPRRSRPRPPAVAILRLDLPSD